VKKRILSTLALFFVAAVPALFAQEAAAAATTAVTASSAMWKYISAALAVGASTIGGGLAVGQIGAAAMAAMSENPELSGKAIPFVGLAEGICLWGFIVALMILSA
jgi:V/A-type H+/Na+-transporting ATPase subunit K